MSDSAHTSELTRLLKSRPDPEANDRGPSPDNWDDYVFGQTARAICLGQPSDRDRETIAAGIAKIAPRDPLEDMIAAQMLACHDAAMDCYASALNNAKSLGLRREHLTQAGKLSRTFGMLLDALNRHRGKGQQRIVVEHVTSRRAGRCRHSRGPRGRGPTEIGKLILWNRDL
jgi:hypothetical protein